MRDGNLASFKACVTETASLRAQRDRDLVSRDAINWTAPTPEFEPWSGVRERSYAVDPEFAFAGAGQGGTKPPEPFDFILQIAFTSPPYAGQSKPWFSEQTADSDDSDPWLFSDSDIKITENVVNAIELSTDKRDIYDAMREFVWMQRLFRAAFAGSLGDAFPIERLTDLARDASAFLQRQRTVRWQLNAGELRLMDELQDVLPELQLEGRVQAAACLKTIKNLGSIPKIYAFSDEEWDRACRFSGQSLPEYIINSSVAVSEARRLRPSLGIVEESQLPDSTRVCGRL
jgi:hypothetical protein